MYIPGPLSWISFFQVHQTFQVILMEVLRNYCDICWFDFHLQIDEKWGPEVVLWTNNCLWWPYWNYVALRGQALVRSWFKTWLCPTLIRTPFSHLSASFVPATLTYDVTILWHGSWPQRAQDLVREGKTTTPVVCKKYKRKLNWKGYFSFRWTITE